MILWALLWQHGGSVFSLGNPFLGHVFEFKHFFPKKAQEESGSRFLWGSPSTSALVGSVRTLAAERGSAQVLTRTEGGWHLEPPTTTTLWPPRPAQARSSSPTQPRPHCTCQVINLHPPTPTPPGRPGLPLLDWPRVPWSVSNQQPFLRDLFPLLPPCRPRGRPASLWLVLAEVTQRAVCDRRAGLAQVPWHGTDAVGEGGGRAAATSAAWGFARERRGRQAWRPSSGWRARRSLTRARAGGASVAESAASRFPDHGGPAAAAPARAAAVWQPHHLGECGLSLLARPPAGRAEHGYLRLPRPPAPQPVRARALHLATAPHRAQVVRRRWPPRFPACCPFGPTQHPWHKDSWRETANLPLMISELFFFFLFSLPPLPVLMPFSFLKFKK